jgi:hypothetical protein
MQPTYRVESSANSSGFLHSAVSRDRSTDPIAVRAPCVDPTGDDSLNNNHAKSFGLTHIPYLNPKEINFTGNHHGYGNKVEGS